jgi:hypothetical protein
MSHEATPTCVTGSTFATAILTQKSGSSVTTGINAIGGLPDCNPVHSLRPLKELRPLSRLLNPPLSPQIGQSQTPCTLNAQVRRRLVQQLLFCCAGQDRSQSLAVTCHTPAPAACKLRFTSAASTDGRFHSNRPDDHAQNLSESTCAHWSRESVLLSHETE